MTKIDIHSEENQKIIGKLVHREVTVCISTLVYELSQKAYEFPDYSDDLYEAYRAPDYETSIQNWIDELDRDQLMETLGQSGVLEDSGSPLNKLQTALFAYIIDNEPLEDFVAENGIEVEYSDVFEHYVVSGWLAARLEAQGEKVIHNFFGFDSVWCRCTTGQAILLDGIIGQIAREMEILDGQKHAWNR